MSIPFDYLVREAESINVKLEVIAGVPVWEASPVFRHQWHIDRIRASLKKMTNSPCGCFSIPDTLFKFPDGSQKRPDIAILCEQPALEAQESALEMIPVAVVEIISKTYEYKDLVLAPPFYLEAGVLDILIFNPSDNSVLHYRPDFEKPNQYLSPITLHLECGCEITV
jgi:Uma2 family endonuclease